MKDNKVQIDTGRDILTLESYFANRATVVTAYVNGLSIRCNSLHLGRIADAFIDTLLTACTIDNDEDEQRVAVEITDFINNSVQ